jgi:hypothetical protein
MDGRNTRRTVYRSVRGSDAVVRNAMTNYDAETVFLMSVEESEERSVEEMEREAQDEADGMEESNIVAD